MVHSTWAEETLQAKTSGGSEKFHVAAQRQRSGADGKSRLVVRLVNGDGGKQEMQLSIEGAQFAQGTPCTVDTLAVRTLLPLSCSERNGAIEVVDLIYPFKKTKTKAPARLFLS